MRRGHRQRCACQWRWLFLFTAAGVAEAVFVASGFLWQKKRISPPARIALCRTQFPLVAYFGNHGRQMAALSCTLALLCPGASYAQPSRPSPEESGVIQAQPPGAGPRCRRHEALHLGARGLVRLPASCPCHRSLPRLPALPAHRRVHSRRTARLLRLDKASARRDAFAEVGPARFQPRRILVLFRVKRTTRMPYWLCRGGSPRHRETPPSFLMIGSRALQGEIWLQRNMDERAGSGRLRFAY